MTNVGTAGGPHRRQSALSGLGDAVLKVDDLRVEYRSRRRPPVRAVDGLSFSVDKGTTLGLVGESGSGKSSTGRSILCLPKPTRGSVQFQGEELTRLRPPALRRVRTHMQMIFQDSISALNPRRRVADSVAAPLLEWRHELGLSKSDISSRAVDMFEAVGLSHSLHGRRYPHEFSGGQAQRVGIARALILEPTLLICDEPVSALDVSVQAQILNLLEDMRERYNLTMVFISHDLAVVRKVADRVAVMYRGSLCELGEADSLYSSPRHPYTRTLLAAIPRIGAPGPTPGRHPFDLQSAIDPPGAACKYRDTCPFSDLRCASEEPALREVSPGHFVACHHAEEIPSDTGSKTSVSRS